MRLTNMITAVDLHAAGEPGRVIVGGVLDVPGRTMFEKMKHFEAKADDLRKRMLREPRGYPAANCNLILPPTRPDADAGFIIMEQVEYPPMSGTNTICVATALLETGHGADARAGHRAATRHAGRPGHRAGRLRQRQGEAGDLPQRAGLRRRTSIGPVEVPHLGTVTVDVAWGGMFYVIADAAPFGLRLTPDEGRDIVRIGRDDQGGHARAAAGGAPGEPGHPRRHHRPALRPARRARARTGRTP